MRKHIHIPSLRDDAVVRVIEITGVPVFVHKRDWVDVFRSRCFLERSLPGKGVERGAGDILERKEDILEGVHGVDDGSVARMVESVGAGTSGLGSLDGEVCAKITKGMRIKQPVYSLKGGVGPGWREDKVICLALI